MAVWEKIRKFNSRIYGEDTIYIEEKLDKVVEALKENSAILEKKLDKIIQILETKSMQENLQSNDC